MNVMKKPWIYFGNFQQFYYQLSLLTNTCFKLVRLLWAWSQVDKKNGGDKRSRKSDWEFILLETFFCIALNLWALVGVIFAILYCLGVYLQQVPAN